MLNRTMPADMAVRRTLSFAVALGTLGLTAVALTRPAHAQTPQVAKESGAGKPPTGIPSWMLPVPGGQLTIGLTAKEALDLSKEMRPNDEKQRRDILKLLLPELGKKRHEVAPFYMAQTLVTNEQYLTFVKSTGHRFPIAWWRDGQKKHFEAERDKILEEFGKEGKLAFFYYWQKHWKNLPYAIPEGQEKLPVSTVSWEDANAFAAWAGMRLPTELEWLAAATNVGKKTDPYLLGAKYEPRFLDELRMKLPRDQVVRPVGETQPARGPLGHDDMVGNVYEWMGDVDFTPLAGREDWEKEYQKVKADRFGSTQDLPNIFEGHYRTLKGASCYSGTRAPELELRIGFRYRETYDETTEAVGFRVAKSDVPARDMTATLLRIRYDYSDVGGRQLSQQDQVGIERYQMAGNLIASYHAASFVPLTDYAEVKGFNAKLLLDQSQERPIPIGVLITTEKMAEPLLEPGIYTIYYRHGGTPAELTRALREGRAAILRAKQTGKEEPPKEGALDWRGVIDRFGITPEELEKTANIPHMRLAAGGLTILRDDDLFLFRKSGGDFVASLKGSAAVKGGYKGPALTLGTQKSKLQVVFSAGVQAQPGSRTQHLQFALPLTLDQAHDVSRPWRAPGSAQIAPGVAPGGANNVQRQPAK